MIVIQVVILKRKSFSEDYVNNLISKIDSEFWKCPIFVGSLQNLGDILKKNKYVGLISDKNWAFD